MEERGSLNAMAEYSIIRDWNRSERKLKIKLFLIEVIKCKKWKNDLKTCFEKNPKQR